MAIGAFPLIKLGSLAIRQISKPLANHLKNRAKNSHFFRTKICIPTGQLYHRAEVQVKARLLNLRGPGEVVKLNEQAAIDLGSELIGETIMFIIPAAAIIAEYSRQSRRNAEEKASLEERLQQIEAKIIDSDRLDSIVEQRFAQLEAKINDFKIELDKAIVNRKK